MTVLGLVMVGASALVSVKVWLTVPLALVAVIVIGKLPPLLGPAVPEIVAVPLPLSVKLIPAGRAPDSVSAGVGAPVVVTVKLNGAPTIEVADEALVMVGPTFSVRTRGAVPTSTQSDRSPAYDWPKAPPLTVVFGGTVTGTLTSLPLLATVTTPFVTLAVIPAPASAVAQALCLARVLASATSVIGVNGALLLIQVLYRFCM